jgi:hypothetical protein
MSTCIEQKASADPGPYRDMSVHGFENVNHSQNQNLFARMYLHSGLPLNKTQALNPQCHLRMHIKHE